MRSIHSAYFQKYQTNNVLISIKFPEHHHFALGKVEYLCGLEDEDKPVMGLYSEIGFEDLGTIV